MNCKRLSEVAFVLTVLVTLLLHPLSLAAQDPTQEIIEAIMAFGIADPTVQIEAGQVFVRYEQPPVESEMSFFITWLYTMEVVVEKVPSAREVLIETHYLDAPCLEVSVKTEDVKAYLEDRLDVEQLLDQFSIKELRPPEWVIYHGLLTEGIAEASVTVAEEMVLVRYNQPHVESDGELIGTWFYIMGLAVDAAPFVDTVVVQVCFEDEPELTVTAGTDDIIAFITEEITTEEFLSRVSIERVTRPAPLPIHLVLFAVAGAAGLAILALSLLLLVTRRRPVPAPAFGPEALVRPGGRPEELVRRGPSGPPESLD